VAWGRESAGDPGPGLEAGVCGTGGSWRPASGAVAVPLAAAPSGAAARSAEPLADPTDAGLAAGGDAETVPAAARSSRAIGGAGTMPSGRGPPPGRGADGRGPCGR
jgi:hypothetical protein